MKKVVFVLALVLFLCSGLAIGYILLNSESDPFQVEGITAFRLEGDMITPVRIENPVLVKELEALINNAEDTGEDSLIGWNSVWIHTEYPEGETVSYRMVISQGRLCLHIDSRFRVIDPESFAAFEELLGDIYPYIQVPNASLVMEDGSTQDMPTGESEYEYMKMDFRYYPGEYGEQPEAPVILFDGDYWPELRFGGDTEDVSVLVVPEEEGQLSYTGTWEGGQAFILEGKAPFYRATVTAEYRHSGYQGAVTYELQVETDLVQPVHFEVKGSDTFPGEMVVLRAFNVPEGGEVLVRSDISFTPEFFDDDGVYTALFPVSYYNAVGEHQITLTCGDVSESYAIIARDKEFQIQDLTVDEETAEETINSQAANAEYERVIGPLRTVADPVKYWVDGGFAWPLTGPVSTEFGMIRYTNGAPTSTRHGAIDFAVPLGTEVKTAAAGRVLYAGFLQLTGNTVVIEHGYGLKSWYYHMDSLDVNTGGIVVPGQKIGEVGSTGFSTGAHLHFGMSVKNVYVNPTTVIDTDLLQ